MKGRKRLTEYQRYRDRHSRQPTSEEESPMQLLGMSSVQELNQGSRERADGPNTEDPAALAKMNPPDDALALAMREAEEEEDEAEGQEEIDQLRASRAARVKPQLLRNLNHAGANPERDPEVYRAVMTIGMINFEAGSREFLEWSARMVQDIGERFRPLLSELWTRMPTEARLYANRKLQELGAGAKADLVKKINERVDAFEEIEKKPLGLVDVTGKEVRSGDEAKAKSLEPFARRAVGLEAHNVGVELSRQQSTEHGSNSLRHDPPQADSDETRSAGSLHSHICPASGKYWTHQAPGCETNQYLRCGNCREEGAGAVPPETQHRSVDAEIDNAISGGGAASRVAAADQSGPVHAMRTGQDDQLSRNVLNQFSGSLAAQGERERIDARGRCSVKQRDVAKASRRTAEDIKNLMGRASGALKHALTGRIAEPSTAEVLQMSAQFADWMRKDRARKAEAHRKAVAADPSDSQAWSDLAADYGDLGQHDKAIEAYQRILTIDPNRAQAWIGLGATYSHLKRCDEANAAYARAVELEPRNVSAWFRLGSIYRDQGRLDQTKAVYKRLREIDRELARQLLPWHSRLWSCLRDFASKKERKQLGVLVAVGVWMTVTVLLEILPQNYTVEGADAHALARVFLLSLPALLLGGIFFWWFGRNPGK